MSICSAMSEVSISISINGQEMTVDTAINDTFREIQSNLNDTQTKLRTLAQIEERSETFQMSHELCTNIDHNLKEITLLFKDLRSIVKQVKLKPETPEEKQWMTSFDIEWKNLIKEQKNLK